MIYRLQLRPCSDACSTVHRLSGKDSSGKERDETGLDYFGARYLSSALGRWTSPDAPFADQQAGNPQSWNLYNYTRNNPLIYIDQNGEKTEIVVGKNTENNPFGHISVIINGVVYSYGTNYTNTKGGNRDWGANASEFLDAQKNIRQTELLELNVTPEQEQSLVSDLESNNPNAEGAKEYDVKDNSCVTVIEEPLERTGILEELSTPIIDRAGEIVGNEEKNALTPNNLAKRIKKQPELVKKTTTVGVNKVSQINSWIGLIKEKIGIGN